MKGSKSSRIGLRQRSAALRAAARSAWREKADAHATSMRPDSPPPVAVPRAGIGGIRTAAAAPIPQGIAPLMPDGRDSPPGGTGSARESAPAALGFPQSSLTAGGQSGHPTARTVPHGFCRRGSPAPCPRTPSSAAAARPAHRQPPAFPARTSRKQGGSVHRPSTAGLPFCHIAALSCFKIQRPRPAGRAAFSVHGVCRPHTSPRPVGGPLRRTAMRMGSTPAALPPGPRMERDGRCNPLDQTVARPSPGLLRHERARAPGSCMGRLSARARSFRRRCASPRPLQAAW